MNELRIKELTEKMKALLERNAHWRNCSDGSYEMALSVSGYYDLGDELKELRGTN
jgi:hypothetical protein